MHPQILHVVWKVLTASVCRRLDYDCRLCPAGALHPAISALRQQVHSTARAIAGWELSAVELRQLALPTRFGGCGLAPPDAHAADAAFWAGSVGL
eukprot:390214-Lingulodinium_polyedra.AAC.1